MAKGLDVHAFTEFPGLDAIEKTAKKRTITLKAVKAGAKIIVATARAIAPKRKRQKGRGKKRTGSGALKQSLGVKAVKGRKGNTLALAIIGARTKVEKVYNGRYIVKPHKYAHLVEKGTKPHSLLKRAKTKEGKAAREVQVAAGKGGRHPGTKPNSFLRPALVGRKKEATQIMLAVLAEEIRKALAGAPARNKKKTKG